MKAIKIQWYLVKPSILPVLYLVVLAAIITLATENIILSSLISATLIAVKLISLPFEVDSNEKLDRFYSTLPISCHDFILSRYGFLSLIGVIGIVITLSLRIFIVGLWKNQAFFPREVIMSLVIGIVFYILIICLQLPLYYKYGALKARLFSMIPILLFVGIFSLYNYTTISTWLLNLIPFVKNNFWLIQAIGLVISVSIVYISFYISKKIVENKGASKI